MPWQQVTDGCDLPPTGVLFKGTAPQSSLSKVTREKPALSVSTVLQTQLKLTSDFPNLQPGLQLSLPIQVGGRTLDNSLRCGG